MRAGRGSKKSEYPGGAHGNEIVSIVGGWKEVPEKPKEEFEDTWLIGTVAVSFRYAHSQQGDSDCRLPSAPIEFVEPSTRTSRQPG